MYQKFLFDANFHVLLNKIDQELANNCMCQGCPNCKGVLDRSDYPRSPLGVTLDFRQYYNHRISFCCRDCRRRVTPTSVRFFGRLWHPAPFFMLISVLNLGISQLRLTQIKKYMGLVVSLSTWRRWRRWWRDVFIKTQFWEQVKGLLPPTPSIMQGPYPRVFLDVLQGTIEAKIILLLRLFMPISIDNGRAV